MLVRLPNFGEALRKARVRKKLSQRELAQRLGVTQATISHAEAGRDLRVATLVEIARALDLEPLLAPRSVVPAIVAVLGEGGERRTTAIHPADEEVPYTESDPGDDQRSER